MTHPETNVPHEIGSDGYCFTCQQVPCAAGRKQSPRRTTQLDRIEAKLNRLLRAAGQDVDHLDGEPPAEVR